MGDVLSRSLAEIPQAPEDENDWLSLHWEVIVGAQLATVSRLERVAPQTLFVTLAQPEWKPALKSIENRILSAMNQQSGRQRFNRVVYKTAEPGTWTVHVPETQKTEPVKKNPNHKGNPSVQPTLEHIKDKDLLATMQRIASRLNLMVVILGATVLLSNCTTQQQAKRTETVELKDSYAVKQIEVLKQKHPEWQLNDPRGYYHFLMGLKFQREGDFDRAAEHFRTVAEVDPTNEEFQGRWIELAHRTGQLEEALQGGLKALERFPKNTNIRVTVADILAATGRREEAVEQYKKLIQQDIKNSRGHLMLAHTLESMGNYRQAFDYYERALEIEVSNPLTYYFYGRGLARNGQYDRAIEKLEKALSLRPSLQDARETLAFALEKKKIMPRHRSITRF